MEQKQFDEYQAQLQKRVVDGLISKFREPPSDFMARIKVDHSLNFEQRVKIVSGITKALDTKITDIVYDVEDRILITGTFKKMDEPLDF